MPPAIPVARHANIKLCQKRPADNLGSLRQSRMAKTANNNRRRNLTVSPRRILVKSRYSPMIGIACILSCLHARARISISTETMNRSFPVQVSSFKLNFQGKNPECRKANSNRRSKIENTLIPRRTSVRPGLPIPEWPGGRRRHGHGGSACCRDRRPASSTP